MAPVEPEMANGIGTVSSGCSNRGTGCSPQRSNPSLTAEGGSTQHQPGNTDQAEGTPIVAARESSILLSGLELEKLELLYGTGHDFVRSWVEVQGLYSELYFDPEVSESSSSHTDDQSYVERNCPHHPEEMTHSLNGISKEKPNFPQTQMPQVKHNLSMKSKTSRSCLNCRRRKVIDIVGRLNGLILSLCRYVVFLNPHATADVRIAFV